MSAPRNGSTIRKTVHAALPQPERSRRRKTSVRITIMIQIHATQMKKMIIDPEDVQERIVGGDRHVAQHSSSSTAIGRHDRRGRERATRRHAGGPQGCRPPLSFRFCERDPAPQPPARPSPAAPGAVGRLTAMARPGQRPGLHRTILFQAFPRTGLPRPFEDYTDWVSTVDLLLRCGAIPEPTFLWWDARPQPRFGTDANVVFDVSDTGSGFESAGAAESGGLRTCAIGAARWR